MILILYILNKPKNLNRDIYINLVMVRLFLLIEEERKTIIEEGVNKYSINESGKVTQAEVGRLFRYYEFFLWHKGIQTH